VLILVSACSACGQKGPPLPPLVLIPAPPVVTADRRGSTIEIGFIAPSANVDGSRPDIWRYTAEVGEGGKVDGHGSPFGERRVGHLTAPAVSPIDAST